MLTKGTDTKGTKKVKKGEERRKMEGKTRQKICSDHKNTVTYILSFIILLGFKKISFK